MLASGVALTGWSPRLGKRLSGVALHRFISCYSAGSAWRRRGSRVAWRRRRPPAWRGGSRVAGEQAPRGGGEGAGPAWRGGGAGSAWRRRRPRVAEVPRGGGAAGPAWRGRGSRVAGRRPRGAPGRLPLHSRRGRARAHPRRRGSPLRVAGPCGPDGRCEPLFGRRDGCCRLNSVSVSGPGRGRAAERRQGASTRNARAAAASSPRRFPALLFPRRRAGPTERALTLGSAARPQGPGASAGVPRGARRAGRGEAAREAPAQGALRVPGGSAARRPGRRRRPR